MTKEKNNLDWFIQRTIIDGKVSEASYRPNRSSAVLHTLHKYGSKITREAYSDGHGLGPERDVDSRELDQMKKDLLSLPTEELKKKYPTADISDTKKTSEQVENEKRRSEVNYFMLLNNP